MATLSSGTLLAPHLKVVRKLGQGAMGKLWVAEDQRLGQAVAVKLLAYGLDRDPKAVRRFQREFETASAIDSPHVVRMLDCGLTERGVPFIVMELLEGESLEQRLERTGPLTLEDTLELVRQVGDALDAAHARGIVHRDVKPDNILLLREDRIEVKVLDFGLAKTWSRHTLTGSGIAMGTPDYMSPEQVLGGKHVDHRSDLWALGVVTYQALLGRLPFHADNVQALMFVICRGAFRRPSELGAPRELDSWFERALKPDKDLRFGSAGEMALALELVLATLQSRDDEDTVIDVRATRELLPRVAHADDTAVTPVRRLSPPKARAPLLSLSDEKTIVRRGRADPPSAEELPRLGDDDVDEERTRLMPKRKPPAAPPGKPSSGKQAAARAEHHDKAKPRRSRPPEPRRRWLVRVLFAAVFVAAVALAIKRGWIAPEGAPPEQPGSEATETEPVAPSKATAGPAPKAAVERAADRSSAPDEERAYLSIRCRPGCAVWVERENLGSSPVVDAPLAPGPHRVVVYRAGAGSKVLKIDLKPGERASYEVFMQDVEPTPAPDPEVEPAPEPAAEPAPAELKPAEDL